MRLALIPWILSLLVETSFAQDFPPPSYLRHWGGTGGMPGQFFEPADLAVADDGTVYVVDRGNHRVQRFTADGTFLLEWSQVEEDVSFGNPTGIDIDASGNVYVADLSSIHLFTADGTFTRTLGGPTFRVAVDDGEVYGAVGDSVFVSNSTGQVLRGWVIPAVSFGNLHDVSLFPDGRLAVIWPFMDRIFVMERDGSQQTTWGSSGNFSAPNAVASDGRLAYVADSGRERIVVLSLEGTEIGSFPVTVPGLGALRPTSLDFDSQGELYVLAGSYVVVYAAPIAVETTTWSKLKTLFR